MKEDRQWQERQFEGSNREETDEREVIFERGALSVLKNQGLASLLSTRPPFNRTEKECRVIADYLKQEPYFQSMSRNFKTLLEISNWIQYRQAEVGEYIYRVHELADCFYILLKGEVHLTYPEKEVLEIDITSLEQNDANSTQNLKDSTFYPTAVPPLVRNLSVSPPLHEELQQKQKRLTRHESLIVADAVDVEPPPVKKMFEERIVQMVNRGESFGDLGNSSRRGTNAVAKEVCQLLLIKKQHFGTLSTAQVKSESKAKFELLSSLPLFQLLYRHSLESLIYLMEEVKLSFNSTVYAEHDPVKFVYVVFRGQFKLYKRVRCGKQGVNPSSSPSLDAQERRGVCKNISFKTIGLGEVLACTEAYRKVMAHQETCVCKSQDGIVLRIDKVKFIKKLLSPENNLEEIAAYIDKQATLRAKELADFLSKYENNQLFARYLHTPSARSRRVNTESSVYKERSQRKDELRKLSTASNNFFNEFNKTVKQEVRSTRISIKRTLGLGEHQERGTVPSRIRDIIGIVDQESNYFKIRKPKENITLFQFSISKVPIHVKKKYEILFKRQNK